MSIDGIDIKQLIINMNALKELHDKSTKVNAWYAHGWEDGTVRGPFHRWFKCSEVEPRYAKHVAGVAEDTEYCAGAMNLAPYLINAVETLLKRVSELELDLEMENVLKEREDHE